MLAPLAGLAAAAVDLSTLDGTNGFRLDGIDEDDYAGHSVSSAGDVNGDGFDDLIIGAPAADPGGASAAGETYVVFGRLDGFSASFDLSTLDGDNGFRLDGVDADDKSGWSVSSARDVNGDGFDDLIIGAYWADPGGDSRAGATYVVFGHSGGFSSSFDLSTLDGSNGFRLDGVDRDDYSGWSVSSAGDVNGDGFHDMIVGAYRADPGGRSEAGETYVVFGRSGEFSSSLDLSTLDGSNGFRLDGVDTVGKSGCSVSSAGDVNGDNFDDLIIGAYGADPGGDQVAGETYVVFGHSGEFSESLDLSTLDGTNGFRLDGVDAYDQSGWSVSSAGDVNGDSFDDLIIGAYEADPGGESYAGEIYVVFGQSSGFSSSFGLSSLDGSNGFRLDGVDTYDRSGCSVSSAHDVNGDGFDDLLIGAYGADPGGEILVGATYVVFGHAGRFAPSIHLAALDGTNGFRLDGVDPHDYSGRSVSSAGDVNGDGFDDLIIGAANGDPGGDSCAGETYVVFGGNFTGGVETQVGDNAPNTLTAAQGATVADILIGGQADDVLIGDGGPDVLRGGEGEDTLAIPAINFQRLVGGNGTDTLRLDGSGVTLDLTTMADNRIVDVEQIDITGSGANTLILNAQEVLNLSSHGNTLLVKRDLGDTIHRAPGWTLQTLEVIDGATFYVFTQDAATLKLQVAAANTLPTASDNTLNTNEDVIRTIAAGDFLFQDADSGDTLVSVRITSLETSGSLELSGTPVVLNQEISDSDILAGNLRFVPAENANGSPYDSFGFQIGDGVDFSALTYTMTMDVTPVNDAPVNIVSTTQLTDRNLPLVFSAANANLISISDIDAADNPLEVTLTATHGTLTLSGLSGLSFSTVTFTGTVTDVNTAMDGMVFAPETRYLGMAGVEISVNDQGYVGSAGALSDTDFVVIEVGVTHPPLVLSSLDGTNGFRLDGVDVEGWPGYSASPAGDVNGDGFDDLIIGAGWAGPDGNSTEGATYVVFGQSSGFPATLDLSTLDGANGFRLDGIDTEDFSGSASSAGDVNGDGFDDLIIGADHFQPGGNNYNAGETYVVFGHSGAFSAAIDLSTLDGANGFRLDGVDAGDGFGGAVSSAGDINGDGFNDLIVRADGVDPGGGSGTGVVYVVFGQSGGFVPAMDLSTLDGTNGFRLDGVGFRGYYGHSVSSAGDVNGDGFDDLILGTPWHTPGDLYNAGGAYVVFGQPAGFAAAMDLSTLDGTNGFWLPGVDMYTYLGRSVSLAGDVNGDGFDDLIIGPAGGAPGGAYVVFGHSNGFSAVFDLAMLDGANGFRLDGVDPGDDAGHSVSSAGDVNGDGFDDLIIGATGADHGGYANAGETYIVFGRSSGFSASLDLSTLDETNGFRLDGIGYADSGRSVSSAGDVNGDGFDDLIIGAWRPDSGGDSDAGKSSVVFGGPFTANAGTQVGDDGPNTLTAALGNTSTDMLVGGQDDDLLIGDGGPDVLLGGEGDDTLAIPATDFQRLAGGNGADTLRLDGSGLTLDLTAIADTKIIDIEQIDITGSGDNSLTLDVLEVLNLSTHSNTLLVKRDLGDTVNLGSGWTQQGVEVIGPDTFIVLTHGAATLKVQAVAVDPPRVADVFFRGSDWKTTFLEELDERGHGHATIPHLGFANPVGDGSQLDVMPWSNVNQISVVFDQETIVEADDLIVMGVETPSYDLNDAAFSYDPATFTATWSLVTPLPDDKLLLLLDSDSTSGVKAPNGVSLDGEWVNSADTFPSGDGTAGGDFAFRANMHPGNVNGDDRVTFSDFFTIRARLGQSPGEPGYDVIHDLNGDARITFSDAFLSRARLGVRLPAGEPGLPPAQPPAALVDYVLAASLQPRRHLPGLLAPRTRSVVQLWQENADEVTQRTDTRPARVSAPVVEHLFGQPHELDDLRLAIDHPETTFGGESSGWSSLIDSILGDKEWGGG